MIASNNSFDVIIIGAGISGINSAYRLQEGIPDYSYAILEGREEIGGTWSLFKYPGIRSDSDLFTFGFAWDPWKEDRAIASAPSILSYVKSTAHKHGIDSHIKYKSLVKSMNWSTENQHWELEVMVNGTERTRYYARFICLGTGYYDYTTGLNAKIPGIENFEGTVVHPQFWPEDLDYTDKRVTIIGSGATAVTLLPAMTDKAKHITMLQRSPSYFMPVPLSEPLNLFIKKWFPENIAHQLIRLRFLVLSYLFYTFCRMFPNKSKQVLRGAYEKQLPDNIPFEPHFIPRYNPWEQRMCITPGGDFFQALRQGKSDIKTDTIANISGKEIKLTSGETITTDIIVTATGLKMQFGGGAQLLVDNEPVQMNKKFIWRGVSLQDVPNLTFVFGYANASWTLGADATAQLWVRLLKQMKNSGMSSMTPTLDEKDGVKEAPLLDLTSTYVRAAAGTTPMAGDRGPWIKRSSYFKDIWHAKFGDIQTGLRFDRISS